MSFVIIFKPLRNKKHEVSLLCAKVLSIFLKQVVEAQLQVPSKHEVNEKYRCMINVLRCVFTTKANKNYVPRSGACIYPKLPTYYCYSISIYAKLPDGMIKSRLLRKANVKMYGNGRSFPVPHSQLPAALIKL